MPARRSGIGRQRGPSHALEQCQPWRRSQHDDERHDEHRAKQHRGTLGQA